MPKKNLIRYWLHWLINKTALSETVVPGQPVSLRVRPMSNSIAVSWNPPKEHMTVIRGFILGYGVGIPDVFRLILDAKQRSHTIKGLSESIISITYIFKASLSFLRYSITIWTTAATVVIVLLTLFKYARLEWVGFSHFHQWIFWLIYLFVYFVQGNHLNM